MLWYCAYTWHHGTTADKVRQRIVLLHDATSGDIKSHLKGWYNLAGGGAGFLLIDEDDPAQLSARLMPYMDLMAWDVRAVYGMDYDEAIQRFKSG